VGTMSLVVCGFPGELLCRRWCWFSVQFLIKSFMPSVALLFRHTSYTGCAWLCFPIFPLSTLLILLLCVTCLAFFTFIFRLV
jgi:hypothetical protein